MQWVMRFLSFDKLIGLHITRALYFVGLGFIVLVVIWTMIAALGRIFSDFLGVIGLWIGAPLAGVILVMLWRLSCERFYIYFRDNAEQQKPSGEARAGDPPAMPDISME